MFLAIDIGNTSIYNGIFDNDILKKTFRIPAHSGNLGRYYKKSLKNHVKDIDCVIVASVVPTALKNVEKAIWKVVNKKCIVVGKDIDTGVKNLYRNPKQVGIDRLVNARAAHELYGGECIIVDFGTAITIDVVNKKRQYLGGVIVPGPGISLLALSEKTALLPKVTIKKPKGLLGKETKESMISGIVYGFSSLCDGIVRRLKKQYYRNAKVIITGGFSMLLGPYCETADKIDPELTLKGLQIINNYTNRYCMFV